MPKFKVVVRAFYEDAYLDFFIKWYLELGFDRIDILKADHDIHGDGGLTNTGNDKVRVIPVANTGNQILVDMYHVFRDLEFDWVLNIDADEYLMIDRTKYPNGIGDMVRDVESWMIGKGVTASNLQMMAFNWICIDKLDIKPGTGTNGACTMQDMVTGYPLHVYSFIKSFVKPSELPATITAEHNCHNMVTMPTKVYGGIIGTRMCHILGESICEVTTHKYHFNKETNNFKWGFILHLNTRSLANALTKSLVTQLRRRKQIADLNVFTALVNGIDTVNTGLVTQCNATASTSNSRSFCSGSTKVEPACLCALKSTVGSLFTRGLSPERKREVGLEFSVGGTAKLESVDLTYKHGIMEQFKNQLNLKWWFPIKVRNYHNSYNDTITEHMDYANNILKTCKPEIMSMDIVDRGYELKQLEQICVKAGVNWDKCKAVLDLF
jgi:hypothetical protein